MTDTIEKKTCRTCEKPKYLNQFYDRKARDGTIVKQNDCISCVREFRRLARANKPPVKQYIGDPVVSNGFSAWRR